MLNDMCMNLYHRHLKNRSICSTKTRVFRCIWLSIYYSRSILGTFTLSTYIHVVQPITIVICVSLLHNFQFRYFWV